MSHVQARLSNAVENKTCFKNMSSCFTGHANYQVQQRLQLLMSFKQVPCMHKPSKLSVHLHQVKTLFFQAQRACLSCSWTITQKTPFPSFENSNASRKLQQRNWPATNHNCFAPRKLPRIAENFQSLLKTFQKTPNLLGGCKPQNFSKSEKTWNYKTADNVQNRDDIRIAPLTQKFILLVLLTMEEHPAKAGFTILVESPNEASGAEVLLNVHVALTTSSDN